MLSRVSRPTLPRWAPIALLLAVGWLGLVSIAAPATVRAAEINPRECLNWGQFGLWEGSFFFSTRPPRNDVIDRVNDHRPYLLPEADGRMLGSLKVPGEQILENDPGLISGDMELTPNTRIREYRSPQHATRFVLHDDGSFEYTPVPGYFGEDSFQYLWERTGWCSQPATVTINPLVGNIIANDHYVLDAIPLPFGGDGWPLPEPFTAGETCIFATVCGIYSNDPRTSDQRALDFGRTVGAEDGWILTEHGRFQVDPDGRLRYRPDPGFIGKDRFDYRFKPSSFGPLAEGGYQWASVTLDVQKPGNGDVKTVDDHVTVVEDTKTPITEAMLTDNDQRVFEIGTVQGIDTNFSQPPTVRTAHGTLTPVWYSVSPLDWVIFHLDYEPDPDYVGPDWFTYLGTGTTTGGNPAAKTGIVFIDVTNTDDPPVALGTVATTTHGVPVTFDPLVNAYDPDGDLDPASFQLTLPDNGVTLNPDGTVTYSATLPFGNRIHPFTIADAKGATASGFFNTRVLPGNPDAYTVAEDQTLTVDAANGVRVNDGLTFGTVNQVVTDVRFGDLTLGADGAFTYTPDPDFAGIDSFTYKTTGGLLGNDFAEPTTVTITVTHVADAPDLVFNLACFPEGGPISCTTGDLRQVDEGGTVRLRGFVDDADVNPTGTLSIDWGDGTAVQHLPYPCTADGSIGGDCTTPLGYEPTFIAEVQPGRIFFDLTHRYADDPPGSTAAYTISATANDGTLEDTATAAATVRNVAPTLTVRPDCTPTLVDPCFGDYSDLTVALGDDVDVRIRIRDTGGDDLRFTIDWGDGIGNFVDVSCSDPASACSDPAVHAANLCDPPPALGGQGGQCGWLTLHHTYAAQGDYPISISINDGDGGLAGPWTGTAHVTRANAAPTVVDDEYEVDEEGTLTVTALTSLLANDGDADAGDSLTAAVATNPTKGAIFSFTAAGTFVYSPNPNAFGTDTFTYQACDTLAACTTGTVTITIAPMPDAPIAVDDAYTTDEDTSLIVVAPAAASNDRDPDGDALLVTQYADPPHGTAVTGADGQLEYMPDADFSGVDEFTYTVCDSTERCATGTVRVTVSAVNDPPVAGDDVYEVVEGELLEVDDLFANDSDVDSTGLVVELVSSPAGATTFDFDAATGSFDFRSSTLGQTTFTYRVTDPDGASDVAEVRITVRAAQRAPEANSDDYRLDEDAILPVAAKAGVLFNDSDPDGDELTAILEHDVEHGTLTFASDGSFLYVPDRDYNGFDWFAYVASDGERTSYGTTVWLRIVPVNDDPIADDDAYETTEDTVLTVPAASGVLAGDTDVDGDELRVETVVQGPSHGSVEVAADGSFRYRPDADYFGSDSFIYRVSDGELSDTATVNLTILSDNDRPTIALVDGACRSEKDPVGALVFRVSDVETAAASLKLSVARSGVSGSILTDKSIKLSGSSADRTAVITADAKKAGSGTLTFTVTDAAGGTASLAVNVINGDQKDNVLTGIIGPDLIFGGNGNDTLTGGPAGDTAMDVLCGGSGDDTVRGGAGNDVVDGGGGSDTVEGGTGDDQLFGASGVDTLRGDAGADRFHGGGGKDVYADVAAAEGDVRVEKE